MFCNRIQRRILDKGHSIVDLNINDGYGYVSDASWSWKFNTFIDKFYSIGSQPIKSNIDWMPKKNESIVIASRENDKNSHLHVIYFLFRLDNDSSFFSLFFAQQLQLLCNTNFYNTHIKICGYLLFYSTAIKILKSDFY